MRRLKKTAATVESVVEQLKEFNNSDIISIVSEINSEDGYFEDITFYHMTEFNDLYSGVEPLKIADDALAGGEDFNTSDDYFKYDGNGCLVSYDESDAASECFDRVDEIAEWIINHPGKFENSTYGLDLE